MRRGRWWKPRRRRRSTASSISAAAAAWPSATSWKRSATSSILPCPWGSAPLRTGPIRSCTSRPTSRGSARPPGGGRPPASPTASRAPWSGIVTTATATPAELARACGHTALRRVLSAAASHIGTCLSIADLLAVLYASVLRVDPHRPDWPARDRFILSKGHGAAIFYAVLAERGFFPRAWLEEYCRDGGRLCGHATCTGVPGVEVSTGSLGHGLSIASGMALAAKRERSPAPVFVVLSDGELDEGSTWEAGLFAAPHRLDNLVAMVDYNKIQSFGRVAEVLDLDPLADKWRAFRWGVREIDGHDHATIAAALGSVPLEAGRPRGVVPPTRQGEGGRLVGDEPPWALKTHPAAQPSP